MRVGVTGATGLIGSALVAALRERGDVVVPFVRAVNATANSPVIHWDPARDFIDHDDLDRVGELDAVVHLAGAGIADRRWSAARKTEILASRTKSTALLADTFVARSLRVLASGSAIGIYGNRGDDELDERSTRGDGFLADVCAAWESASAPLAASGTRVAHLRTGIVLSRRGGALAKQLPLFRLGLGGRLGTGRQWFSPISLRDEVRAIAFVLDHELHGAVNLVGPTPLTNRDFTATLAHALHRPAVATVPPLALRLALGRDLADEALLASQRVVPRTLTAAGFTFLDPRAHDMVEWAIHS